MRTFVVGCNHRSAPLPVREKLAFDEGGCTAAVRRFRASFPEAEALILSTCNRTELYFCRPAHAGPRLRDAIEFLAEERAVPLHEFSAHLYHHEDSEALRHLFRVAGSLDSMVVGESQILAQAKRALDLARPHLLPQSYLDVLFQRAFAVAKDVHAQTGISAGRVSVGSVALDMARQVFARIDDKCVLLVGAGEMGEVALRHLTDLNPRRVLIVNRSTERADELARRFSAESLDWSKLSDALAAADIVLASTGAAEPIITTAAVAHVRRQRADRPLLLIDLAVPRDIEPSVAECEGVILYNIDDLQRVADEHWAERRSRVERAGEVVEAGVAEFVQWQTSREIGPVVRDLRQHLEALTRAELEWLRPKLKAAGDDWPLIEQLVSRVIGKVLHQPTEVLSEKSQQGRSQIYVETVRRLFGLDSEA